MQAFIEARGIDYVWHFTKLSNLDSILRNGLISRQQLEKEGIPHESNDNYRYDNQTNAICCSVGHPNYKMFYPLWHGDRSVEWVVIGCKPDILWEKDCAFCVENAASNNVTCIPIEDRKGEQAFKLMFDEVEGIPTRAEIGLPDSCPTNPQAEILVFDRIEPENIIGAICQSKSREVELIKQYPDFEFLYHRAHYSARKGWEHWQ